MNIVCLTKQFLDLSINSCRGVQTIRSWRFWVCLLAMTISACVLAGDPLFFNIRTGFQYGGGVLCIVVSYLILSALFWDLLLCGKPQGANLFLQWVALLPFTLFMARTFTKPTEDAETTVLGVAWEGIQLIEEKIGLSKLIANIMPQWALDIFSHWSIAMVLLFVVVALCFKKRSCKIGFLFTAIFVGIAGAFSAQVTWQFIVGTLSLLAALVLLFNPYDEQCFYYNWISRLSGEPISAVELDIIAKVLGEAYNRGRLSYDEVGELILSRLPGVNCDERALNTNTRMFVDRLLRRYDFVALVGDSSGMFLTVNPRLLVYNSLTYALAIYPRRVIIAMVGVVWLISPLDIIPDAIPFLGVLDDAAIAILSAKSMMNTKKQGVVLGKWGPVAE